MHRYFFAKVWLIGLGIFLLFLISCSTNTRKQTESSSSVNPSAITNTSTPSIISTTSTTNATVVPAWVILNNWTPANQIRTMLIDNSGNLWTGVPSGLVYWDLKTNQPKVYVQSAEPNETNVVALAQAFDDSIWIGTFRNGIKIFDNVSWQSFTTQNGLPGNYVVSLIRGVDNGIWLDVKKTKYDTDDGQKYYFGQFKNNTWIPEIGGGFSWILPLPDGTILGARGDTGIAKHDSKVGVFDGKQWNDLGPVNQTITAIAVAPEGIIWAASRDDVFIMPITCGTRSFHHGLGKHIQVFRQWQSRKMELYGLVFLIPRDILIGVEVG